MSVYAADGKTYDDQGRWLKHVTVREVGSGTVFIDGRDDKDGSIAIRLVDGVARFQIRENGVFKDTQLLPMVGENLVYNNDLGLVLNNSLCPIYLSEFQ